MASADLLAGASVANPYVGIASGFATGLGSGISKSAGPSDAVGRTEAVFDNSGWNVIFGGGDISSVSDKTASTGSGASGTSSQDYTKYFALAVGAVLLWRMTRKK